MENLIKRLEEKGITQKQLAEAVGCHSVTMSRYINDHRDPDVKTLIAMADYLDTSIDYLVGRTKNPAHVTMSEVDARILSELADITPGERTSLLAFLAGLKANRAE